LRRGRLSNPKGREKIIAKTRSFGDIFLRSLKRGDSMPAKMNKTRRNVKKAVGKAAAIPPKEYIGKLIAKPREAVQSIFRRASLRTPPAFLEREKRNLPALELDAWETFFFKSALKSKSSLPA